MTLRAYLLLIAFATALCWVSFGLTLFYIDYEQLGWIAFVAFFGSLILSITGTLALLLFFWRAWRSKTETVYNQVGISFRQGLLFSLLVSASLGLRMIHLLSWWNFILLALAFFLLELLFQSQESYP